MLYFYTIITCIFSEHFIIINKRVSRVESCASSAIQTGSCWVDEKSYDLRYIIRIPLLHIDIYTSNVVALGLQRRSIYMRNTISLFKSSSRELRNVKCLTVSSMLMALSIILGYMSFYLSPSIRISFTYVPIAIIGILYGPVVGAFTAGAVDLLNFVLKPGGAFTPGITLCALLTGFTYGIFLYRKSFSITRLSLAVLCNTVFVDLLLKSYVLACLQGLPFIVSFAKRLPVQGIMLILNTIIIYLLVTALKKSHIFSLIRD